MLNLTNPTKDFVHRSLLKYLYSIAFLYILSKTLGVSKLSQRDAHVRI